MLNSPASVNSRTSVFQSLDWLICYWNHFGDGQRLRVLVVMSQGAPIGILPLIVRRESTRAGPLRVLTYPLHDWGSYYGPIGPHPSATLLAGLGYIRRTPTDWDLLDLRWVDFDGRDRGRTLNAMRAAGFSSRGAVWKELATIDTTGTWETYLANRGGEIPPPHTPPSAPGRAPGNRLRSP